MKRFISALLSFVLAIGLLGYLPVQAEAYEAVTSTVTTDWDLVGGNGSKQFNARKYLKENGTFNYHAWSQGQLPWGLYKLGGNSEYATFNNYGCLVTAFAKIAVQSGNYSVQNMDPGIMNELMQRNGCFKAGNGICNSYANTAKLIGLTYVKTISYSSIVSELKNDNNKQFIIYVKNSNGQDHYVPVNNELTLKNGSVYVDNSGVEGVRTESTNFETSRSKYFTGSYSTYQQYVDKLVGKTLSQLGFTAQTVYMFSKGGTGTTVTIEQYKTAKVGITGDTWLYPAFKVTVPNYQNSKITTVGFYVYTSKGEKMYRFQETYKSGVNKDGTSYKNTFFGARTDGGANMDLASDITDVSREYFIENIKFTAGHTYKVKGFVVFNGKQYESTEYTMSTTGSKQCIWNGGTITTQPTCTATGVKTYTCITCGETKTETLPKKDHTPGPAATCTTPQTCTVCGTQLKAALGHNFSGSYYYGEHPHSEYQKCTRCNAEKKTGNTKKVDGCSICYPTVTFTITYNANGGTGAPSSQTKESGKALTLSSTNPTRQGYTFLGWATSAGASNAQYNAGSSFTTDANTTLYAVWRKDAVATGAKAIVGSTSCKKGDSIKVRIILQDVPNINSILIYDVSYDASKLKLISGKLVNNTGVSPAIGPENLFENPKDPNTMVIGFANDINMNGEIAELEFKILDSASEGKTTIGIYCDATSTSGNIDVSIVNGEINITSVIRGDVNGDGKVNNQDAIYLLKYTLNASRYPINQNGDMDGNGKVNNQDAIYLLKHTLNSSRYPLYN